MTNYRDSLNERVYHRTMGYVHLYIAYNEKEVSLDDVTVSFLREAYPRKLMEYFNDKDFIKEMIGMGLLRDMFQDEFEEKDKKIRDLSEQLQTEQEENAKLRRELEEFKKLVGNKIAML